MSFALGGLTYEDFFFRTAIGSMCMFVCFADEDFPFFIALFAVFVLFRAYKDLFGAVALIGVSMLVKAAGNFRVHLVAPVRVVMRFAFNRGTCENSFFTFCRMYMLFYAAMSVACHRDTCQLHLPENYKGSKERQRENDNSYFLLYFFVFTHVLNVIRHVNSLHFCPSFLCRLVRKITA